MLCIAPLSALIEQPVTTPVEATITQTQINGKNFVWNFKDLYRHVQTSSH